MRRIRLLPVGEIDTDLAERLADAIEDELDVPVRADLSARLDPTFAYHPERRQYHSTPIVEAIEARADDHVLGVTAVDLFIPILTFVFGEAETGGRRGIVSFHRLRQDFYGLPGDPALLEERLVKEALHEIGHLLGLHHCDDYDCVMSSSHAVEWIDVKHAKFCERCRPILLRAIAADDTAEFLSAR